MSEKERDALADAADMIVNNYAFTKDGANVRVLNLRTGSASVILSDTSRQVGNVARQISRRFGRATGARICSAADN